MGLFQLLADVLFVGHSLIGPDLPLRVEEGLRQIGQPQSVAVQLINGAPLRHNLHNGATAEGVDALAELAKGETKVLILTEAIPLAEHLRWNDTPAQIAAYAQQAHAANPDVKVYLYETWHSRNSGPGYSHDTDPGASTPWRARLDQDLSLWEGAAQQAASKGVPVALIPAGQAMARLSDAVAAGQVSGITDMADFFSDDIHLSDKGIYFIALVHLAVISGKSPEGLPARLGRSWASRDAVLSEAQALALQRIAWAAVSGYQPAAITAQQAAPEPASDSPEISETLAPADLASPEPTATIAAAIAPPALPEGLTPITNPNLAMGLNGITDWSVQQPFLDVMKTARDWTGHLPGAWGGWDHGRLVAAGALDTNGWPRFIPPELSAIATLVLVDLPADAQGVAGRYLLTHEGKGTLLIEGRAQNLDQSAGEARFDFTPGEGGVILTISQTDAADPIRNIVLVREDRADLLAAGQIFNPDWLARLQGVKTIRLMDWMRTNDSPLAALADRPKPGDYTYTRIGAPIEVMVALANTLDANPWFTLPHLAEDDLVRFYADYARDQLEPGRIAHVEYSNEVWNWQFAQAAWAEEQGRARWGRDSTWVQFYALRASEIADIWTRSFGAAAKERLVRIIATQTGWLGLEEQILTAADVIAENRPAPASHFDAYAVTGYFSALLGGDEKAGLVRAWLTQSEADAAALAQSQGLDPSASAAFVAQHRYDSAADLAVAELQSGELTGNAEDSLADLLGRVLPHHAAIAQSHNLRLMMYEGGTHVVGMGGAVDDEALTKFFLHLNYSPQMAGLYGQLLQGWARLTPEPFNAFVDVASPGKWGSWGALRHLGDDNPRWQALAKGCVEC